MLRDATQRNGARRSQWVCRRRGRRRADDSRERVARLFAANRTRADVFLSGSVRPPGGNHVHHSSSPGSRLSELCCSSSWRAFATSPTATSAIVEKRWSIKGSLPKGFIALGGEAGYQPNVLRGGVHFLMPLQYRVHRVPLVTIPQGKMGYVFARDGLPLAASQALASNVNGSDFQDVASFLPKRRTARSAAPSPERGHLRHQSGPVRGALPGTSSTT